jgi:hydroxymethylpyrimidine/phosphomethylpyrimidine kinase
VGAPAALEWSGFERPAAARRPQAGARRAMTGRRPPRLLTIAGSDPSGGAGIQADLKTFAAHDVYGMAVVTAITAQSTAGVLAVEAVAPELVERQIRAVLDDVGVDAIKIGMLANAEIVSCVARCLDSVDRAVPVVLDPVLRASDGTSLLGPGGLERLAAELLPRASVITPNRAEAWALLDRAFDRDGVVGSEGGVENGGVVENRGTVENDRDAEAAARALAARGPAVLVTGGDATGSEVVDVLVDRAGALTVFRSPRLATRSTHGTGCTLSAAVAVGLARGRDLAGAVGAAVDYVRRAMDPGLDLGQGRAPLDHGVGGPREARG